MSMHRERERKKKLRSSFPDSKCQESIITGMTSSPFVKCDSMWICERKEMKREKEKGKEAPNQMR